MAAVFETRNVATDEEIDAKIRAEIMRTLAETAKLHVEARWHPLVVTSACFAAGAAFGKVLEMLFKP